MNINDIHRGIKKHKRKKRLGRGPGSGHGKTSGRGHKGQKSHAGWSAPPSFQGGQMPLVRRVPKRGFNNRFAIKVAAVNVGQLEVFENGQEIGIEQLRERDLVHGRFDELKVLGNGQLTRKLKVAAHRFSASAREKIEQAGGTVVVTASKTPVAVKQKEARARARAST